MTSADCPACRIAAERHTGLLFADCRGCRIRDVAMGPAHHRSRRIKKVTEAYRRELVAIDADKWSDVHEEVKAVWNGWKEQIERESRRARDRAFDRRADGLPSQAQGAPA